MKDIPSVSARTARTAFTFLIRCPAVTHAGDKRVIRWAQIARGSTTHARVSSCSPFTSVGGNPYQINKTLASFPSDARLSGGGADGPDEVVQFKVTEK